MEQAELDALRPEVPEDLTVTLRPYQIDGFHFLTYLAVNRFGGILADDMGLGKTVQTITWVLWLRSQCTSGSVPPTVVVCPKSVLDVWAIEFKKAAPHIRVQVLHDKDELEVSQLHGAIDVLVMNYAQLRGTIEELKNITFLAAILDEGQQIKNPDSKAAKAARDLNAHNRLVLSGTPMENRLLDLWSLMTFATPGALGDRGYFHRSTSTVAMTRWHRAPLRPPASLHSAPHQGPGGPRPALPQRGKHALRDERCAGADVSR